MAIRAAVKQKRPTKRVYVNSPFSEAARLTREYHRMVLDLAALEGASCHELGLIWRWVNGLERFARKR